MHWNLADNVDIFLDSEFYGSIANDADIPSEDLQKYVHATSDFTKGIQTDIDLMWQRIGSIMQALHKSLIQ